MAAYTTGEIAKQAGVSVRTVQYYDTRGILCPSDFSEGGRRLYNDSDLQKLKIICYLRDLGLSINNISHLFEEREADEVLTMLLEEQERELKAELTEQQEKLENLGRLKRELHTLKEAGPLSVGSIGDAAYKIESSRKLRRTRIKMITVGLLIDVLEWGTILYWVFSGDWRPFVCALPVIIIASWWITRFYFKRVAYICPSCHKIFVPGLKESLFANHTPTLRNVTCTHCGRKGYCVEVHREEVQ